MDPGPSGVRNGFGCWQRERDLGVFSKDQEVSLEGLIGTQGNQVAKNGAQKSKSQHSATVVEVCKL